MCHCHPHSNIEMDVQSVFLIVMQLLDRSNIFLILPLQKHCSAWYVNRKHYVLTDSIVEMLQLEKSISLVSKQRDSIPVSLYSSIQSKLSRPREECRTLCLLSIFKGRKMLMIMAIFCDTVDLLWLNLRKSGYLRVFVYLPFVWHSLIQNIWKETHIHFD